MNILPHQIKALPPVHFNPRRLHHWLAFGAGSGLLPKAPGTWGTAAALPLYWLCAGLPLALYLLLILGLFAVGVWACGRAGDELGVADHPAIVWDEIVGYFITLIAMPPGLAWMLAGFLLFRGFDILKPWPICWLDQNVGGGWGVMLDDVAAGLFALVVLQTTRLGLAPGWLF